VIASQYQGIRVAGSKVVQGISCLVDTDIAIDFLRRREYAKKLLEDWAEGGLLAISTLTHLEIYQGIKSGEETATDAFLDGLVSIDVDISIARMVGKMLGSLRLKGKTISIADAIIAATALHLDVPLITNNISHYPFPDLRVIKGSAA
jgi:predicted nucleic acid-binding protein